MRIGLLCLASLFVAGCYLSHERMEEAPPEVPPPFVPCDGFYRVVFDAATQVGAIDITLSVTVRGVVVPADSCGFVATGGIIYTAECGTMVPSGESLVAQVTPHLVTLTELVPIELCHTDVEVEETIGMVRITCGSEELPFERVPYSDGSSGCVYLVR